MGKDLEKLVEKEIAKGTTPLSFESISIDADSYKDIDSREKLIDVLQYLLRVRKYRKLLWNDALAANNVYMDVFLGNTDFHRAPLFTDGNAIFQRINWHGGKLKPDYNGKTVVETAKCVFSISAENLEKCKRLYNGKESYSFYFGKNQIRLLYADCLEGRKAIAIGEVQTLSVEGKYSEILRLNDDYIRAVLFQALILDDLEVKEDLVTAKLHTIYLLR